MLDSRRNEKASVRELIEGAGMTFAASRKGNVKTRLEMHSPKADVPLKINISELMAGLLPGPPGWFNVGSAARSSGPRVRDESVRVRRLPGRYRPRQHHRWPGPAVSLPSVLWDGKRYAAAQRRCQAQPLGGQVTACWGRVDEAAVVGHDPPAD